jgi:hypothetical protein
MDRRSKITMAGLTAAALIAGGSVFGVAAATGGGERPLTGETRDRAVAAALAKAGPGTVTETETGDDGAAYSVEIRRADGSQVEVNLDESFRVTGSSADEDGPKDADGPGDSG